MGMITPIREETFKNAVFDAGILLKDFNYSSATDAATLAQLIATTKESGTGLLGATKGGVNPQTSFTFWEPELDGKRMSFKGSKRTDSVTCKIAGTLVEFTGDNLKDVIALADKTTSGRVTTIQPRFDLTAGDYVDHIVWIGNWGDEGLVLVDLSDALCTVGLNMQSTDKEIGTLPFEFEGHASGVSSTELPIKYLLFSAASVASAMNVYSVEGTSSGKTKITVTPQAASGQSYKYKTSASVALPGTDDVLTTGWASWDGDAEITATTGNQLVVAVVTTANNKCVAAGRTAVVSKA